MGGALLSARPRLYSTGPVRQPVLGSAAASVALSQLKFRTCLGPAQKMKPLEANCLPFWLSQIKFDRFKRKKNEMTWFWPICPSIDPSICPTIHPSVYLSINLSIYPSLYPSIHQTTRLAYLHTVAWWLLSKIWPTELTNNYTEIHTSGQIGSIS